MSLNGEEIKKMQKTVESVEAKIDIMKDELTDAIDDIIKQIQNLDVFCRKILEKNQKIIYKHLLKIEGQEVEEEEKEEEE